MHRKKDIPACGGEQIHKTSTNFESLGSKVHKVVHDIFDRVRLRLGNVLFDFTAMVASKKGV